MKVQLLLRRVDPLDVGSDDFPTERAYKPAIGTLDAVVARTATNIIIHRSAATDRRSRRQEESRGDDR